MSGTEPGSLADIEAGAAGGRNPVVFQAFGLKRYYPVTAGPLKRRVGDVKAVDGVDLEIRRGQTQGLVGESGCGKSTLARLLAHLDEPTAGHIYFDVPGAEAEEIAALEAADEDDRSRTDRERLDELRRRYEINTMRGSRASRYRRNVQFVFQNPTSSLNPKKLIRSIVGQPLRVHADLAGEAFERRLVELLEVVGLGEDFMYRYPHMLSGGQKQRVAIARAIALNPDCVILDEPTSALDVSVQAQILNLLGDLQTELDLTYLFITHDLGVIRHVADEISVMYLGHIVEETTRQNLFSAPKHPYTEALISSSPAVSKSEEIRLEGDVPDPEDPPTGCPFHTRCHKAEAFCGWSGPDVEALLRTLAGTDGFADQVFRGLNSTSYDGYAASFTFEAEVDVGRVAAVLRGDDERFRAQNPPLFEAIGEVSVDGHRIDVRFREAEVPAFLEDDPEHFVACHLFDDRYSHRVDDR